MRRRGRRGGKEEQVRRGGEKIAPVVDGERRKQTYEQPSTSERWSAWPTILPLSSPPCTAQLLRLPATNTPSQLRGAGVRDRRQTDLSFPPPLPSFSADQYPATSAVQHPTSSHQLSLTSTQQTTRGNEKRIHSMSQRPGSSVLSHSPSLSERVAETNAEPCAASVTYPKSTESRVGAVTHGVRAVNLYGLQELCEGASAALAAGLESLVQLSQACGVEREASVPVLRNACGLLVGAEKSAVQAEHVAQVWPHFDWYCVAHSRVRNKHARQTWSSAAPKWRALTRPSFTSTICQKASSRQVASSTSLLHDAFKGWERLLDARASGLRRSTTTGPRRPRTSARRPTKPTLSARPAKGTTVTPRGPTWRASVSAMCP